MTTRSIHDTIRFSRVLQIQTLSQLVSPDALQTGNIDLRGFDSAMFGIDFGDIDEMGGSPVADAKIQVLVEHAEDDGSGSPDTYANVGTDDIDGATPASGIVATATTDANEVTFGYTGGRRFVRLSLIPTGLTNGGPVGIWMIQGHAHLSPVTQG